jgi:DNA-binding beta-propeller fold protein YncE
LIGDNAEVISIRHEDGVAAISNTVGSVDVLDLSDPLHPSLRIRVPIDTTTGTPNSVAVHPEHDFFLVVTGKSGVVGSVAAHRLSDGALLATASVGIQPDAVAISPNGQYAVVANEAEGTGPGGNGGAGSLSIVDLTGFNGVVARDLAVTNVPLTSLAGLAGVSTGRTDDLAQLPIDNSPETLEPENVAFSPDSRFAFVTLQENNAVIRLEVRTGKMSVVGLGQSTHAADLTNGGGYLPVEMLTAFREPDGIVVDQTGRFFVTADEGDTRNAAGSGSPRGGRTISLFEARSGRLIADTGRQLDDAAAAAGVYPDNRSNRGGAEPESVDIVNHRGLTLVAVALERGNAVALVDVSEPAAPVVIDLAKLTPQIGPEAVKFFRRGSRLFVASGNEVSGTVSILEVVF